MLRPAPPLRNHWTKVVATKGRGAKTIDGVTARRTSSPQTTVWGPSGQINSEWVPLPGNFVVPQTYVWGHSRAKERSAQERSAHSAKRMGSSTLPS